jgi:Ca2+-binding RTX toxin-like protein
VVDLAVHLYGGPGDDAITMLTATYAASIVDGGAGRDRIDVSLTGGCCLDILGRDGADTINVVSARSVDRAMPSRAEPAETRSPPTRATASTATAKP